MARTNWTMARFTFRARVPVAHVTMLNVIVNLLPKWRTLNWRTKSQQNTGRNDVLRQMHVSAVSQFSMIFHQLKSQVLQKTLSLSSRVVAFHQEKRIEGCHIEDIIENNERPANCFPPARELVNVLVELIHSSLSFIIIENQGGFVVFSYFFAGMRRTQKNDVFVPFRDVRNEDNFVLVVMREDS